MTPHHHHPEMESHWTVCHQSQERLNHQRCQGGNHQRLEGVSHQSFEGVSHQSFDRVGHQMVSRRNYQEGNRSFACLFQCLKTSRWETGKEHHQSQNQALEISYSVWTWDVG